MFVVDESLESGGHMRRGAAEGVKLIKRHLTQGCENVG
jgi:hypothetical protein